MPLDFTLEYTITPQKDTACLYPILNNHSRALLFVVKDPDDNTVSLSYLFPGDETKVLLPHQVEYCIYSVDLDLGAVSYFPDGSEVNSLLEDSKIFKLDIRHISQINKTILASAVKSAGASSGKVSIFGTKKDRTALKSISSESLIRDITSTDTLKVSMDDISQYQNLYVTIIGEVDTAFNYK